MLVIPAATPNVTIIDFMITPILSMMDPQVHLPHQFTTCVVFQTHQCCQMGYLWLLYIQTWHPLDMMVLNMMIHCRIIQPQTKRSYYVYDACLLLHRYSGICLHSSSYNNNCNNSWKPWSYSWHNCGANIGCVEAHVAAVTALHDNKHPCNTSPSNDSDSTVQKYN